MKASINVQQLKNALPEVKKAVEKLTKKAVYIGVPAESAERAGGISNAELSYIHEFGAPANNLPARPHLRPGVERILPEAVKELEDAASLAMQGDERAVDNALIRIGIAGQESVQQMFTDNEWQALSERTLNYKPVIRNEQGQIVKGKDGKPLRKPSRLEVGKVNPLFLTGSLKNSHIYVIRERKNNA